MSVAARVAREMGVKLGNEVSPGVTDGRGEPHGSRTLPTLPSGPRSPGPGTGPWSSSSARPSGSASLLPITNGPDRLATASALRTARRSGQSCAM